MNGSHDLLYSSTGDQPQIASVNAIYAAVTYMNRSARRHGNAVR